MKKFFQKLWAEFLTQFGKLKVMTFGFLPILAYEKRPYLVNGYDIHEILGIA